MAFLAINPPTAQNGSMDNKDVPPDANVEGTIDANHVAKNKPLKIVFNGIL